MITETFVDIKCPLHSQETEVEALFECQPNNWAQKSSLQVVKCRTCGLIFFSPNIAAPLRRLYHNENYYKASKKGCVGYPDYVEEGHAGAKIYFGKLLVTWFSRLWEGITDPPKSVIDLGCATGHMLTPFQTAGFELVVGIDFSKWAIDWGKSNLDLDLRCQDMDFLKLKKNEIFDSIIFWDSLEHSQDPRKLLRKLYIHSSKDVVIIVQLPDVDQYGNDPSHPYWSLYQHSFHYNAETLGILLGLEGFKIKRKLPSSQPKEMLFAIIKNEGT